MSYCHAGFCVFHEQNELRQLHLSYPCINTLFAYYLAKSFLILFKEDMRNRRQRPYKFHWHKRQSLYTLGFLKQFSRQNSLLHTVIKVYSYVLKWLILVMSPPIMSVLSASFPRLPLRVSIFISLCYLSFIHELKCHSYLKHCHILYLVIYIMFIIMCHVWLLCNTVIVHENILLSSTKDFIFLMSQLMHNRPPQPNDNFTINCYSNLNLYCFWMLLLSPCNWKNIVKCSSYFYKHKWQIIRVDTYATINYPNGVWIDLFQIQYVIINTTVFCIHYKAIIMV